MNIPMSTKLFRQINVQKKKIIIDSKRDISLDDKNQIYF